MQGRYPDHTSSALLYLSHIMHNVRAFQYGLQLCAITRILDYIFRTDTVLQGRHRSAASHSCALHTADDIMLGQLEFLALELHIYICHFERVTRFVLHPVFISVSSIRPLFFARAREQWPENANEVEKSMTCCCFHSV